MGDSVLGLEETHEAMLTAAETAYTGEQDLEKQGFNGSLPTVTLATASDTIADVAIVKQKRSQQANQKPHPKTIQGRAPAPARSPREAGAELLFKLCNTSNPEEQDRLARQLDAHLMKG
jgi:hypothetical protein